MENRLSPVDKKRLLAAAIFLCVGFSAGSLSAQTFGDADLDGDENVSEYEAQQAGMNKLKEHWNSVDGDQDGVVSKDEFSMFMKKHGGKEDKKDKKDKKGSKEKSDEKRNKKPKDFSKIDADGNGELTRDEARSAGLAYLVQHWDQADNDRDTTLSKSEYMGFTKKHGGKSTKPQQSFYSVDTDGNEQVSKEEAEKAGLSKLLDSWNRADRDGNGALSKPEYSDFVKTPGEKTGAAMTVGAGKFRSPETALWDDHADVYLVSNINGKLTAADDNGFISRVAPDGTILDLKWIDGGKPEVALHGPKGMIFHEGYLIVADVGAVRYFDRSTGKPLQSVMIDKTYMLNDLAVGPDGLIYVSDVGSTVADPPGAVYRIDGNQKPHKIAEGIEYDRPDGLIAHGTGLLVAPFEAHAKEVYELSLDGRKAAYATLPTPKLDGLLRLPDDSIIVTSWKGKAVYRLVNKKPQSVAKGIPSPAQIGYDEKRKRLLLPVLRENKMLIYSLDAGG